MKQQHQRPEITILPMEEEMMQTFTTKVGPGPSPGGGLGKDGFFDEDEENEQTLSDYQPWQE